MSTPDAELRRQDVIRRIIYLAVAIAVVVPFLAPWRSKIVPARQAQDLYRTIESLPEGSTVLFSLDYGPTSKEELDPMAIALFRHCFRRKVRPLVMTHWLVNLGLCRQLIEQTADEADKVSGIDYVFLGNRPGWGNLILNMGENLKGAFDKDFYEKPTADMPALAEVNSLRDVPLIVDLAAGDSVAVWISYGSDRFGCKLGAGCTAVIAPELYPFHQSKQLIGFLGGLRGAADYEILLEEPPGMKKVGVPNGPYALAVPADWTVERDGDGVEASAPERAARLSVAATPWSGLPKPEQPSGRTAEEGKEAPKRSPQETLKALEERLDELAPSLLAASMEGTDWTEDSRSKMRLLGRPALRIRATTREDGAETVHDLLLVLTEKHQLVFELSCPKSELARGEPALERIWQTVQPAEGAFRGGGVAGMPAQSAAHLLIIVLILGANARYIFGRIRGRQKG